MESRLVKVFVPGVMLALEHVYTQHSMEQAFVERARYCDANPEQWERMQQAGYSDDGKTLNQWGIETGELWFGDKVARSVSLTLYHQRWWTYGTENRARITTAVHWRLKGLDLEYTIQRGDHSWAVEITDNVVGVHLRIFRKREAARRYAVIASEIVLWRYDYISYCDTALRAALQVAMFLDADDDLNAPAYPLEYAHDPTW